GDWMVLPVLRADRYTGGRLNVAARTPGTCLSARTTRHAQDAQVMPSTGKRRSEAGGAVVIGGAPGSCAQPSPSHHWKVKRGRCRRVAVRASAQVAVSIGTVTIDG